MKRVLFIDDSALYVDIKSETDDRLVGWVINGHWYVTVDLKKKIVMTGSQILNHYKTIHVVEVTGDGDYNEIIEDARVKAGL